jgi:hypothetical protein
MEFINKEEKQKFNKLNAFQKQLVLNLKKNCFEFDGSRWCNKDKKITIDVFYCKKFDEDFIEYFIEKTTNGFKFRFLNLLQTECSGD